MPPAIGKHLHLMSTNSQAPQNSKQAMDLCERKQKRGKHRQISILNGLNSWSMRCCVCSICNVNLGAVERSNCEPNMLVCQIGEPCANPKNFSSRGEENIGISQAWSSAKPAPVPSTAVANRKSVCSTCSTVHSMLQRIVEVTATCSWQGYPAWNAV